CTQETLKQIPNRSLNISLTNQEESHVVNLLLQKLSATYLPYRTLRQNEIIKHSDEVIWGYVIFIWPEEEDCDLIDSLRRQLDLLKESEGIEWEPRARFVVVVTDSDNSTTQDLVLEICKEMWSNYGISNNVILVPNQDDGQDNKYEEGGNGHKVDIFTGFPFAHDNCGVVVLSKLIFGFNPYVYPTGDSTHDGNNINKVKGISVQYLLIIIGKLNLTPVFTLPIFNFTMDDAFTTIDRLASVRSDITIGSVPLLPICKTPEFEPTISHNFVTVSWFYPCPGSNQRIEKVITTYSTSVWITMTLVYVLTSSVFWYSANYNTSQMFSNSKNFRNMNLSFYNAWAIFLGVSVPGMPNTWKLRMIFLLYVCYSFIMITVFQAFFISFLVEPGQGEKMETLDEALKSDIKFGFNSGMEIIAMSMDYKDFLSFPYSRHVECHDYEKCIERMIYKRDVITVGIGLFAEYRTSAFGFEDDEDVLCTLNENVMSSSYVFLLQKGSNYLNQFNHFIRRTLECGLTNRYWEMLTFKARLRSHLKRQNQKVIDETDSLYFVFSLSHLSPAFVALILGYIISFVVFTVECLYTYAIRQLSENK
ncbi:hypothetical protein ANN_19239, partial [Periplaneta americana]